MGVPLCAAQHKERVVARLPEPEKQREDRRVVVLRRPRMHVPVEALLAPREKRVVERALLPV